MLQIVRQTFLVRRLQKTRPQHAMNLNCCANDLVSQLGIGHCSPLFTAVHRRGAEEAEKCKTIESTESQSSSLRKKSFLGGRSFSSDNKCLACDGLQPLKKRLEAFFRNLLEIYVIATSS